MAKQKQTERVQFVLTSPVWLGSERLPKGHVVDFENDEPTGVYKGRCKPLGGEVAASTDLADATARAVEAEKERDELAKKLAEAEKALAKAAPPPPPQ